MGCYTEDWACFARCFLFPAIGCLTTGYIQAVVVADQCNVFFYVFFGAKIYNTREEQVYIVILQLHSSNRVGGIPFKTYDRKQVLINKIRKERNKRNHSTEKEQPAIIQQIPLQRTSSHAYVTENEKAVKEPKGTTGRRWILAQQRFWYCTIWRYLFWFQTPSLNKGCWFSLLFSLSYAFLEKNMLQFIEGFCVCTKQLNVLLYAEIIGFLFRG